MTDDKTKNNLIAFVLLIAVVVAGYWLYHQPDTRSDGEKLGDALSDISKGFENAGQEFDNKTLGQKLHDDVKAASKEIKHDIKGNDQTDNSNVKP